MIFKKALLLAPVAMFALNSCGRPQFHECKEYELDAPVQYHDGFNILQLTDTHISNQMDRPYQYKFIKKTIDLSKDYLAKQGTTLDLIVITGDLFTFSTRSVATEFFSFLDEQQVFWTCTFGNHDEQAYYSIDWLTGYLNELNQKRIDSTNGPASYCVFKDLQDDDVFGNSNFVINVKKGEEIVEQLYMIDSNRYDYGGDAGYDAIHHDQISWYERMILSANPGAKIENPIPSLCFFHIPLQEYTTIYDAGKADESKPEAERKTVFLKDVDGRVLDIKKEKDAPGKVNTGFYNKVKELNSTRGIFTGHDHINNYAVKNVDDNVVLACGIKATDAIYADEEYMGGQLIMIQNDAGKDRPGAAENFKIHQIIHKYRDLEAK